MGDVTVVVAPAVLAMALIALRLHFGAVAVALVSAGLAVVWSRVETPIVKWGLVVLAPLVVSYAFYDLHFWMLTVTGPYPDGFVGSYIAWALLGLAEWGAAGLIASVITATAIAHQRTHGGTPQ